MDLSSIKSTHGKIYFPMGEEVDRKFRCAFSVANSRAHSIYRNIESTLSQSDVPSSLLSAPSPLVFAGESDGDAVLDREGCVALTGSDAGKLSISPASSLACIS